VSANEWDYFTAEDFLKQTIEKKNTQKNQRAAHVSRVKAEIFINSSHEGKSISW